MIVGVDGHRTAERRSVAYHRAVAARLLDDPALLSRARARVARWIATGEVAAAYAAGWQRLLDGPLPDLVARLTDESEDMCALRQVSPFAGALDARTRWSIWRSVA